jgi:hypothetical protein
LKKLFIQGSYFFKKAEEEQSTSLRMQRLRSAIMTAAA